MNRSLLFFSAAAIASFAIACSASSSDGASSSDEALSGSLSSAKACAVRDAYAAAELSAFKSAAKTELAGVQQSSSSSLSKFDVPNVGTVFVSEDGRIMSFYDVNGQLLAKADTIRGDAGGDELYWSQASGSPVKCDQQQNPPPPPQNEAGSPAALTCLDTTPIDPSQFQYNPPVPAAANKCTTQELSAISSFYQAHAQDADLVTEWPKSVSAGCASCAFGDTNNAQWSPIMTSFDGTIDVDRGGCIGTVAKNEACGRAYQQFQDCTLQACLSKCTTQEEFTACRSDQTVLTTACNGAYNNVTMSCGDKLGDYENACKGTTYTFEGPLKVMCVTGQ